MLTAAAALLTGTGQAPFIPHATARGHLALLWGPGRDPGRPSSRDLQHRVDHPDWRGALTQYTRRRSSVPSGRTPVAPPLTKVPAVGVTCPGPNCRTTAIVPAARLPRAGLNPCRLTNPPQPRWPGARGAPARGPLGGNLPMAPRGVRGGSARHPTGHPAGYRGCHPPVNPDWVVARIPSLKGRSGTPQPPATGLSLC